MPVVIDHVFICTGVGAPVAEKLSAFGLTEGAPNVHPGQGTACRRFFFNNAMIELLWVNDAADAQSEQTRNTRLWERWSARDHGASPFGIIVRPTTQPGRCPFASWEYRPELMPGLVLQIASETSLDEPMWCYMEPGPRQPVGHPTRFREITCVRLFAPPLHETTLTAAMARDGVIACQTGASQLLELEFDGNRHGKRADFRPDLPLRFLW